MKGAEELTMLAKELLDTKMNVAREEVIDLYRKKIGSVPTTADNPTYSESMVRVFCWYFS